MQRYWSVASESNELVSISPELENYKEQFFMSNLTFGGPAGEPAATED